jgi:Uma2 family endonuclease
MIGALRQHTPILSVDSFRAWLGSRPDEEHWELIEGVPMMMTPPNRRHQRIASNLEALLNAALRRHNPALTAYHDIGVNILSTVPYDPEPDVAVIREDENPDPRYADRFYLVAEVLSESDKSVIESKRDIYRAHPSCTCILLVRQVVWKSPWNAVPAMAGARRCFMVLMNSPCRSSALLVWSRTFTTTPLSAESQATL